MGLVNRFLLLVSSLLLGAIAAGAAGIAFGLVPVADAVNELRFMAGTWQAPVVAIVTLLVSIKLFFCSLTPSRREKKASEAIVLHTGSGDVLVATDAIRHLVRELSMDVRGVRDAKVKLSVKNREGAPSEVCTKISLVLGQEANVTETTERVRKGAINRLADSIGIDNPEIEISVHEISNAPLEKKRRVV